MERAKVIVHMYESIDGKIDGDWDGLPGDKASGDYYDDILFKISNTNANGSNTIVMYAAPGHPDLSQYDPTGIGYQDWVPAGISSATWDVSFDRRGRAGWEKNYFDYAGKKSRAIEVVTKLASHRYLASCVPCRSRTWSVATQRLTLPRPWLNYGSTSASRRWPWAAVP